MPVDQPVRYKCGDCGGSNIVIELPPSPWDEHPEDWCFHEHPLKPGVTIFQHLKSEPCELRERVYTEREREHAAMTGIPLENCPDCRVREPEVLSRGNKPGAG